MNRFAFLIFTSTLFVSTAFSVHSMTTEPQNKLTTDWLRSISSEYIKAENVPGIAVAVLQSGKVDSIVTEGVVNRETGEPVNDLTVFQIASLSKIFTGLVANRLITDGILSEKQAVIDILGKCNPPEKSEQL
ncbi:serine hydrolase [Pseudidiomarina sp.]|uniref:serine hydrolase n=1 Tax=Pseudidiomarina sp. TaxID=2081707 RepID=UPI00299EA4CD|nr:serine hydrolase [Pseudidiomarina sp.]MDX1706652.1 serine hydrolase [Pseudidiomarina sp.]